MSLHDDVTAWFRARIPADWFCEPVSVLLDRDEILVFGPLAAPDMPGAVSEVSNAVALAERIREFREGTREHRIAIAREAEHHFERKVSWGAACGDRDEVFTVASVPAMTRLRMPERLVLDTLIDAGIARSRSEALAWCVRLVGRHESDWIAQLREAMEHVERVREAGPSV